MAERSDLKPAAITAVPDKCFNDCTKLLTVDYKGEVTAIGERAFEGCKSLTKAPIPAAVTALGNSAFNGCIALTDVTLPAGVTAVPDACFQDCTALADMKLPGTVTSVGHNAFTGCKALKDVRCYGAPPTVQPGGAAEHSFEPGIVTIHYNPDPVYGWTFDADGTWQGYKVSSKGACLHTGYGTTENTVPPTCGADGRIDTICSNCGEVIATKVIPATGAHTWDNGTVTTEPTETTPGVRTFTCAVCGQTKTEVIPATGAHTFVFTKNVAPSCTEAGYDLYTCRDCGASEQRNVKPALGHKWDSGTVTTEPTETDPGTMTYTCTVCGQTKTKVIPATGAHTWDNGTVTTEPTETTPGVRTFTCAVCGQTKTEVIPATGAHTFVFTKNVAPSCTEAGYDLYTCRDCGASEQRNVKPALGHKWDSGTVTTEPTETDPGTMTYTCTVCGQTKTKVIPATGAHTWDNGTVTTEPTETTPGVRTFTCAVCGQTKTEVIPATGAHTFVFTKNVAPSCTEAGYDLYTCRDCGASEQRNVKPALGHKWDSGTVTTEPTETDPGTMTYTCTVCGQTKTEVIPATGPHTHVWDEGTVTVAPTETTPGVRTYTCTVCGQTRTEIIPATGSAVCPGGAACPSFRFRDVPAPSNWAHEGIDYCVRHGLMSGFDATTFSPDTVSTRAQIVMILYNLSGDTTDYSKYYVPFTDVRPGTWYYNAVAWGYDKDIVAGMSTTTFAPDGLITREQMAVLLYGYTEKYAPAYLGGAASLNGFPDAASVSNWAYAAMSWAVGNGLISGIASNGADYLAPSGGATRAQIAAIMMRYCRLTGL